MTDDLRKWAATAKTKTEAIPVECMECSRKFKTRSLGPVCPRCGGVDVEVRDDAAERRRAEQLEPCGGRS